MYKNDNQEMLMDWEKQLLAEIKERIKVEIEEEKRRNESSRPSTLMSNLAWMRKYNERVGEEFSKYSVQHTLGILVSCGLDLNELKKSPLFNSDCTGFMLEHIQGKIDGYDLFLTISEHEDGGIEINVRERKPNGHPFDKNRMLCTLANDVFIIEIDGVRYEYKQNEDYLVYSNGETEEVIDEVEKEVSKEDLIKAERDLHADMEANRKSREYSAQKSLERGAKYWVK